MTTKTKILSTGFYESRWSSKQLARMAGLFYLVLAIAGGIAHFYIRGGVYVTDDPAETARLVIRHANLVRAGVLIDLLGAIAFLMVGLTLYELLRHVDRFASQLMVCLVVTAVAMTCLNLIFQFGAVLLATKDAYSAKLPAGSLDTTILFMFDLHNYGYILVQAFTGPWLFPFGYLVFRSGMFPKALGWLLIVGGIAYIGDLFVQVLNTAVAARFSEIILVPAAFAEISIITYLIVRGVRVDLVSR